MISHSAAEALSAFYQEHYFGDRALTDRWVWVRLGPLSIPFPNSKGRRNAVALHDLHHILTGYGTNWIGEGEVAAWELASGFPRRHWVGYLYAPLTFTIGFFMAPSRIMRASRRGSGKKNLTHLDVELGRERIMRMSIAELISRLQLQ